MRADSLEQSANRPPPTESVCPHIPKKLENLAFYSVTRVFIILVHLRSDYSDELLHFKYELID